MPKKDWYKLLGWGRISTRPFTYTMREWSSQHHILARLLAYPIGVGLIIGQVLLPVAFGLPAFPHLYWATPFATVAAGAFLLMAHLWWDTPGPYIKHQKDFGGGSLV